MHDNVHVCVCFCFHIAVLCLVVLEGDASLDTTSGRYNESTATMEKLAVLTAWAEVKFSSSSYYGHPASFSLGCLNFQRLDPQNSRIRTFVLCDPVVQESLLCILAGVLLS